jgi:outer membrane protein
MKKDKIFLFFCSLFFISKSYGEEKLTKKNYTLKDCYESALKKSNHVANQEELIIQSEEKIKQSVSNFLPNFTASAIYSPQKDFQNGNSFQSENQIILKLSGSQNLFQGFKDLSSIKQNQNLKKAQIHDSLQTKINLYLEVAQNYYTILSLEKEKENLKNQLIDYEKRILELENFKKIGRSKLTDVVAAKTSFALLKVQKIQIDSQILSNRENFYFLTNLEKDAHLEPIKSEFKENIKDLNFYLKEIENREDVIAAKKRLESNYENIKIQESGHLPTINLSGNYYFERPVPYKKVIWDLNLTIQIPIYNGSAVQSRVNESISLKNSSKIYLNDIIEQNKKNITTYYLNLNYILKQLKLQKEAVSFCKENYKIQKNDFKFGLVTNLDVLQALTSFHEAKRAEDLLKHNAYLNFVILNTNAGFFHE